MHGTADELSAADLLVYGTYSLRRATSLLAGPHGDALTSRRFVAEQLRRTAMLARLAGRDQAGGPDQAGRPAQATEPTVANA